MEYRSVMRQDYDKKLRFGQNPLFCYSKKQFQTRQGMAGGKILGEIAPNQQQTVPSKIEINGQSFALLNHGTKSRLLYSEAGYLQLEDGSFVIVLKSRLPALLLILLLIVLLVVGLMLFRQSSVPVVAPPQIDANVTEIENDTSEKKESAEGGGAVTLTYSLDASLSLATGDIRMYFLNPNASNHDIALALYLIDGNQTIKIAESGRIQPGYGLTDMDFIDNSAVLSTGSYDAMYIVSFYHPETGEKARVESNVTDVKLEVLP